MGFDEILAALPGTGLGGLVVALFVWVLRMGREDRVDYRTALKAAVEDHQAQLRAARDQAAEDRAAAEAEIGDIRRRLADALTVADGERELRRAAELDAERFKLRLTIARERLEHAEGREVT